VNQIRAVRPIVRSSYRGPRGSGRCQMRWPSL
jgi:hypothetical protein